MKAGETPGSPRFHGAKRYTSFTDKQFGNGAALDTGLLVLSKNRAHRRALEPTP